MSHTDNEIDLSVSPLLNIAIIAVFMEKLISFDFMVPNGGGLKWEQQLTIFIPTSNRDSVLLTDKNPSLLNFWEHKRVPNI